MVLEMQYWDVIWNEHVGFCSGKPPKVGEIIQGGFIRYRDETEWRVVGHVGDRVMLQMMSVVGKSKY